MGGGYGSLEVILVTFRFLEKKHGAFKNLCAKQIKQYFIVLQNLSRHDGVVKIVLQLDTVIEHFPKFMA